MQGMSTDKEGIGAVLWLLFSPNGRVSRTWYWASTAALAPFSIGARVDEEALWPAIGVIFIVPAIMISIKRWHDIGKSGWWMFINLIPFIGGIWAMVEQGFQKGTPGSNSYGADPLEDQVIAAPVSSAQLPRQRGTGTGSVKVPAAYRTDRVDPSR